MGEGACQCLRKNMMAATMSTITMIVPTPINMGGSFLKCRRLAGRSCRSAGRRERPRPGELGGSYLPGGGSEARAGIGQADRKAGWCGCVQRRAGFPAARQPWLCEFDHYDCLVPGRRYAEHRRPPAPEGRTGVAGVVSA
jgi:hypothetical protein